VLVGSAPAGVAQVVVTKQPLAVGTGGAVATVDPDATSIGLRVLRRGGNAADAAVAAAAALGVTEPYSAGIGGGGFFLYYDAESGEVSSIDGRETAPLAMKASSLTDAAGKALATNDVRDSGLSVGTPGTPRTWERALEEFGTLSLSEALQPATRLARQGFVVDETFRTQTQQNETRFRQFGATTELFLPGGQLPEVGTVFRNPDLARTYRLLADEGVEAFYSGELAQEIVASASDPQESSGTSPVRNGLLREIDLAIYDAPLREPTRVDYRALEVYGMAPPSSGGTTVGEALNILERSPLSSLPREQALHRYIEASSLAFADRNAYVGDPDFSQVPTAQLLSKGFAAERACLIDPAKALAKPVAAGLPDGTYAPCPGAVGATVTEGAEGRSTTHLTVGDADGNIASYTLTIEATGGSGITVPGRGFLLNNELTDFDFTAPVGQLTANLPAPGKRPRSSMAPTIVLNDGEPLMGLGSPGGSTIITTVLQTLLNRIDFNQDLATAIAAPRVSPRNTATSQAEPAFLQRYGPALEALGHRFTANPEIGAATGVEYLPGGLQLAAAEPTRRGGGSAGVVREVRQRQRGTLAPRLAEAGTP
jgi:gamma-glutamyltranspeptidase/glutathione hydrolase